MKACYVRTRSGGFDFLVFGTSRSISDSVQVHFTMPTFGYVNTTRKTVIRAGNRLVNFYLLLKRVEFHGELYVQKNKIFIRRTHEESVMKTVEEIIPLFCRAFGVEDLTTLNDFEEFYRTVAKYEVDTIPYVAQPNIVTPKFAA